MMSCVNGCGVVSSCVVLCYGVVCGAELCMRARLPSVRSGARRRRLRPWGLRRAAEMTLGRSENTTLWIFPREAFRVCVFDCVVRVHCSVAATHQWQAAGQQWVRASGSKALPVARPPHAPPVA